MADFTMTVGLLVFGGLACLVAAASVVALALVGGYVVKHWRGT